MIFNSLGSNYTFKFALNALFAVGKDSDKQELKDYLEKRYQGKSILLYKGREAIKLALHILNLPQGSRVGITGFTCYAVYQAIKELGLKPVYLDIDTSLNFSPSKVKDLKVLIVQNTLGNPCNMAEISKTCKERGIVLIEDLAHSVGSVYGNKKKAGTVGDFTALSFSQDKSIDAVSGGALIIRNTKYINHNFGELNKVGLLITLKDRFYPVFTLKIRYLYPYGLGKVLHFLLKNLSFLSKPLETGNKIIFQGMPYWHAKFVNDAFGNLETVIKHRREITAVYASNLDEKILFADYVKNIKSSSCLRFPIFVENRQGLINLLKTHGIFVSDIWYDAPIAPRRLLSDTDYGGECLFSEKISGKILNLPTHINVSEKDALYISKLINKWTDTQ